MPTMRSTWRGIAIGIVVLLTSPSAAGADPLLQQPFEDQAWPADWIDWRPSDEANTAIVEAYRGDGLEVVIPPSQRRGVGPHYRFEAEPPSEMWFRYHLRFDRWDASSAGKLPGPAGVYSGTGQGCQPSSPDRPGWSARMMFAAAGSNGAPPGRVPIGYYTYHLDQTGPCGDWMLWNDAALRQGRWYCIEGHVRLNTPGAHDGVLEGWLNGAPAFDRSGLAFRRAGEDAIGVRSFWLNVYFGGTQVVNDRNLGLRIDELETSDRGRIGCLTRFTDDDGNPHEPSIEYLFDEGVAAGCAQNRFCVEGTLSRAEAIVFLDRALGPEPSSIDAFDDDNGSWAESAINRLAPLEIVRGCADRLVCPSDEVSRGQLAAFLRRAFRIPRVDTDYFRDDEKSVFQDDINALAAVGITRGCNASHDRFCPYSPVRRDEAATLIARALRWSLTGEAQGPAPTPPPHRPQGTTAP